MSYNKSIFLIIIAGIMNGSFVIPLRYTQYSSEAKAWLYYSLIGILILPWLFLFCFLPKAFGIYAQINIDSLSLIFVSGLIFGIAQICFAHAIKKIGFSYAFPINIGIGIILGSMFFVFSDDLFFSHHGLIVTASVIFVLLGLFLNYFLGKHESYGSDKQDYVAGWLLAFFAGLAGGFQNIAFVITAFQMKHTSSGLNSFWVWPLFLLAASIPMIVGFYVQSQSRSGRLSVSGNSVSARFKNIFLITLMGICFTGSLWFYSLGMQSFSNSNKVIGWPIFMTLIILTSQAWGVFFREIHFSNIRSKSFIFKLTSIAFLLAAIFLLGFGH